MADRHAITDILVSWVGLTDLKACSEGLEDGEGPVAAALDARSFDLVVLLSNFPKKQNDDFLKWIKPRTAAKVESLSASL